MGVFIFINKLPDYKVRKGLSINVMQENLLKYVTEKLEALYLIQSTRLLMETLKNQFCKDLFSKNSKNLKNMIITGDFNINTLDYEQNE